ncbi:ImcF-related family protein [Enterobacter mori]|uniref:ImcF-related family protein n=1 Tax=Enterobacter mori TaxID=539813 RepID=UPI002B217742|nr:ImcF-related family protein [Enterobacter mori]MEA5206373.1 ImcF-related family protein [Enterobacter mori]
MSSRLLSYLKYSLLALAAPALWALQAWLNGRLGALLASPLPLLLVFGAAGAVLACGLALRSRLGLGGTSQQTPSSPAPREQRLRDIVRAHKIMLAGERRTFVVLNALPQQGCYPPVDDETPRVQDLASRKIGAFPLLEVQSSLLVQNNEEDAGLWWCLLDEFGTAAPQGVVLVMGAEQLLGFSAEQRHAMALVWRQRLTELARRWGRWLPLQILVTECDSLPEFLMAQARLAAPLPVLSFVPGDNTRALGSIQQQMKALFAWPEEALFERLETLPDRQARRHAYVFPVDWGELTQKLQETLTLTLAPQPGQRQCGLQSLRFCAGRDNATVSQTLQQAMIAAWPNGKVRRWARRCAAIWRLSPGALWGVLLLAAIGGVTVYFHSERQRLERITDHLTVLEQQGGNVTTIGPGDVLTERLNSARALRDQSSGQNMSAIGVLASDAQGFYRRLLNDGLLPDSRRRLEQALVKAKTDDQTALLLGHYLTLNGGAPERQIEQTLSWLSESWRSDPLLQLDPLRHSQLIDHLRVLLSTAQIEEAQLNQALIRQMRERLARYPQSERLLGRLLSAVAVQPVATSTLASDIDLFFQRADGLAVTSKLAGHYSREGYRQLREQLIQALSSALAYDDWLMGDAPGKVTSALTEAVLQAYFTDYVDHWDAFLAELSFVLPATDGRGNWMQRLAQPDSALFRLLAKVTQETQPIRATDDDEAADVDPVSQHFSALQLALTQGTFVERLRTALLTSMRNLQGTGLQEPQPDLLAETIAEAPQVLQPLLQGLLFVNRSGMQQQRQTMLNRLWRTSVAASCRTELTGRYPFEPQAESEVSLANFNRIFAPEGELDGFLALTSEEIPANAWFTRSQQLQRFFFPGQNKQAEFSLNVHPLHMHPDIDSFMLTDGVQTLRYAHGPILSIEFRWPARTAKSGLRAQVVLHNGETRHVSVAGQWAWFRLFDQAIEPNDAEGKTLTLDFSGYPVTLALMPPEGQTPNELLRDLGCPEEIFFNIAEHSVGQ